MAGWFIALAIVVIVLLGWWIQDRINGPMEREFEQWTERCLEKQALKRGGSVKVSGRRAVLTVPYKGTNIEISNAALPGGEGDQYSYARFRTKSFADKDFRIIVNSDDFWLKPRLVASRLEVSDERFGGNYVVAATDAFFLHSVLTPEIRDKLLEDAFNVRFGKRVARRVGERGWLTVFTGGVATEERAYDSMIEIAILFHDRLEALSSYAERPNNGMHPTASQH
jgi:hypothetical protein